MRGLRQLILANLKLYLREPISAFFTLGFPVMLVLIFGATFGNEPVALFGGHGSMDVSMPSYTALILGSVGILTVAINTSSYREAGILRRFRATPLHPLTFIVSDVVTNLIMTLAGMACVLVAGRLIYHVRFEGQAISVLLAVVLGALSMSSIGYVIAGLAPSARTAQVIGMVVFYPMLFMSGAGMPLETMGPSIRRISNFLPLTYVAKLLRGLWFGGAWSEHLGEVAVLLGILVVCTAVAARTFRWE